MRYLILPFIFLFGGGLFAKISWQNTELTQEADLFSEDLVYLFEGNNTGTEAIRIESVRASCPCVVASADKQIIEPGDSFVVVAEFDPYEVGGKQRQRIFVKVEGQKTPELLTVLAEMPETVTLSTNSLFWSSDGSGESQTVTLTLSDELDVELVDVYAMDENYSTQLKPVSDQEKTFHLVITPEDLTVERPASIMIKSKVEGRELHSLIRCMIGVKNPFEISYKPKMKPLSATEIEEGLRSAGSNQSIPKPLIRKPLSEPSSNPPFFNK
jgi:hypothetical protein